MSKPIPSPAKGRDQRFSDKLRARWIQRKIERNTRAIAEHEARDPGDDCTDDQFIAHSEEDGRLVSEGVRLLKLANRARIVRFTTHRPVSFVSRMPRSRRRAHRPGAARRASSSSTSSSSDPGDDGPLDGHPQRGELRHVRYALDAFLAGIGEVAR